MSELIRSRNKDWRNGSRDLDKLPIAVCHMLQIAEHEPSPERALHEFSKALVKARSTLAWSDLFPEGTESVSVGQIIHRWPPVLSPRGANRTLKAAWVKLIKEGPKDWATLKGELSAEMGTDGERGDYVSAELRNQKRAALDYLKADIDALSKEMISLGKVLRYADDASAVYDSFAPSEPLDYRSGLRRLKAERERLVAVHESWMRHMKGGRTRKKVLHRNKTGF